MEVGLDPELSKVVHVLGSSYCPNWEGIQGTPLAGHSPSTTLVISHSIIPKMPSSFHTIPGTTNHLGIGHAAICVCGQAGSCTNTGQAITPFMFNEEEY